MSPDNLVMTAPLEPTTNIRSVFDKVALIDADFIKYLVCSDISGYIKRNGYHPREKMGNGYLHKFVGDQLKKQFFDRFEAKGYIFFFSGNSKNTFRYKVGFTKEYKGSRGLTEEAYEGFYIDLASVIGIVSKHNTVYIHEEYEADDIVATLQNEHTFIYSRDKDLKQVPGLHYDGGTNSLVDVSEKRANDFLYIQLLMGKLLPI